jgi:hypothetical protein
MPSGQIFSMTLYPAYTRTTPYFMPTTPIRLMLKTYYTSTLSFPLPSSAIYHRPLPATLCLLCKSASSAPQTPARLHALSLTTKLGLPQPKIPGVCLV